MLVFCLVYPLALVVPNLLVQKFYYESLCQQHAGAAHLTFIGYSGSTRLAPARCRYQGGGEVALKTLGGRPVMVSQIVLAIYTPIGCFLIVMAVLLAGWKSRPLVES
jgi:hypothetical protein